MYMFVFAHNRIRIILDSTEGLAYIRYLAVQ